MVNMAKRMLLLMMVCGVCLGATQTPPQTMLLQHDNQFWLLDLTNLSQELFYDPLLGSGATLGDAFLSSDRNKLYFIVIYDSELQRPNQVVELNVPTGETRLIFEQTDLGRMTRISPDGMYAVVIYPTDSETLQTPSPCLLNIPAGHCTDVNINLDINDTFWLDKDTFVTSTVSSIEKYSVQSTSQFNNQTLSHDNTHFGSNDLSSNRQTIVTEVSYPAGTDYVQALVAIDVNEFMMLDEEYIFDNKPAAAISHVELSPNDRFIATQREYFVEIIDLESGVRIAYLDDVQRFAWSPTGNSIVAVVHSPEFADLVVFDVETGWLSERMPLTSETYFVPTL
jgi:hypothetical protein